MSRNDTVNTERWEVRGRTQPKGDGEGQVKAPPAAVPTRPLPGAGAVLVGPGSGGPPLRSAPRFLMLASPEVTNEAGQAYLPVWKNFPE